MKEGQNEIFDAYRPQKAVTHFMNWALDTDDVRMKEYFYPELEMTFCFPRGISRSIPATAAAVRLI